MVDKKTVANIGIIVFSAVLIVGLATYFNVGGITPKAKSMGGSATEPAGYNPDAISFDPQKLDKTVTLHVSEKSGVQYNEVVCEVREKESGGYPPGVEVELEKVSEDRWEYKDFDLTKHFDYQPGETVKHSFSFDYVEDKLGGLSGYVYGFGKYTASGEEPPSDEYNLSTEVEPSNAGTISLDPFGGEYEDGTEVDLTATPEGVYVFDHWTLNDSEYSSSNTVTVTLEEDMTMKAHFATTPPQTRTLEVNVQPDGAGTVNRVTRTLSASDIQFTVDNGETITVKAVPDDNYVFEGWTGVKTSKNREVEILMDSDKSITANFGEAYAREPAIIAMVAGIIGLLGSVVVRFGLV